MCGNYLIPKYTSRQMVNCGAAGGGKALGLPDYFWDNFFFGESGEGRNSFPRVSIRYA